MYTRTTVSVTLWLEDSLLGPVPDPVPVPDCVLLPEAAVPALPPPALPAPLPVPLDVSPPAAFPPSPAFMDHD